VPFAAVNKLIFFVRCVVVDGWSANLKLFGPSTKFAPRNAVIGQFPVSKFWMADDANSYFSHCCCSFTSCGGDLGSSRLDNVVR